VFMITGFMHAALLRPLPMILAGVFATSLLINTLPGGVPLDFDAEALAFVATIVVIQTLAIGLGTIAGEKLTKLSEDRRRTVAELEAALRENATLHAQLLVQAREAGVLDERQRMAREIHDTLAQGLTGIVTQLEAVSQAKDAPEERQRHFDNAIRLARDSLSEARRSVRELQPEQLDGAGLPDALAEVVERWTALHSVPVEVSTTGDAQPLHPEVEVALLRAAQEALANVAKHARASRVGLTLSYMGDVVTLDVRDDGVGFDPTRNGVHHVNGTEQNGGFGLYGMRQRANRLAGTVDVESEPDGGTAVSVRLPAIPREVVSP
jgi:signal transduction histidine kinase